MTQDWIFGSPIPLFGSAGNTTCVLVHSWPPILAVNTTSPFVSTDGVLTDDRRSVEVRVDVRVQRSRDQRSADLEVAGVVELAGERVLRDVDDRLDDHVALAVGGRRDERAVAGRTWCLHDAAVLALDRQGGKIGGELDPVEAPVDRLVPCLYRVRDLERCDGVEARGSSRLSSRWPCSVAGSERRCTSSRRRL